LVIENEDLLVEEVVRKIYKQKDYSSFARQLNIYGFRRVNVHNLTKPIPDRFSDCAKIWRHEFLDRNSSPGLLSTIQRRAANKRPKGSRSENSRNRFDVSPPLFQQSTLVNYSPMPGQSFDNLQSFAPTSAARSVPYISPPAQTSPEMFALNADMFSLSSWATVEPNDFYRESITAYGHNSYPHNVEHFGH